MEIFSRYWPFVRGIHRSPVNSSHKSQWRGAMMCSLIWVWTNSWTNTGDTGDLRRHYSHYDVIVMLWSILSISSTHCCHFFNTLRPKQNERNFADDIFKCIFLNENVWISSKISLKFVPKGPNNNIPALVQIMAWRRSRRQAIIWTNDG